MVEPSPPSHFIFRSVHRYKSPATAKERTAAPLVRTPPAQETMIRRLSRVAG
ncbi:hypothetical protein GW17_00041009, partial [Ensete ventricosum]